MRPIPRHRPSALALLLGLLSLSAFFACHVEGPGEAKTVFTFATLSDSLKGAEHATILLKDSTGKILDTLFSGPVTAATSFANLEAEGFRKGEVFLEIVGRKDGAVLYRSERRYNTETDQAGPAEILHSPRARVRFLDAPFTLRAGDSVPWPQTAVEPPTLTDKAYALFSLNPEILAVSAAHIKGLKAGEATLLVRLSADTSKSARLTVTVVSKDALGRPVVIGPMGPVNTLTPTWTWTSGGGKGTGNYRYRLDNADMSLAIVTVDTFFTPATALTAGSHTLYVQERDPSGVWSPTGSFALRIDTSAPPAPAVTVSPPSPTRETRPTWSWSGREGDSAEFYRFKLNSDDFRTGARDTIATSFRPAEALAPGSHVLYVQARDSAGNWSPSGSATVLIDTAGPTAPTVAVSAVLTNDVTPTWTWSRSGGGSGTFRYKLDDANLASGAIETKDSSFTPAANLPEGSHTLYVQERDAAGNWSPSGSRAVQIDVTPPTAPRLDSTLLSPLNSLRPRWSWRSGTGGTRAYRARVDTAALEGAPERTDSSFIPPVDLAEGRHTLYVQERDAAGNWSPVASRLLVLVKSGLVGPEGFSTSEAYYLDLNFGSESHPTIAYQDAVDGIVVREFNGTEWKPKGAHPISPDNGRPTRLETSPKGTKFLAYWEDPYPYNGVTVRRLNGNTWDLVGTRAGAGVNEWFSMAVNGNDEPLIADSHFDFDANRGTLFVTRLAGANWNSYGTVSDTASPGDVPSIAIGTGDVPYVAYRDLRNAGKLTVKYKSGVNWLVLGQAGVSKTAIGRPVLRISRQGVPHVLFTEEDGARLSLMRYIGGSWNYVGNDAVPADSPLEADLALDEWERPVVAVRDQKVTTLPKAYLFHDGKWRAFTNITANVEIITSITLALDGNGVPYLGFADYGQNGKRAIVFKVGFDP